MLLERQTNWLTCSSERRLKAGVLHRSDKSDLNGCDCKTQRETRSSTKLLSSQGRRESTLSLNVLFVKIEIDIEWWSWQYKNAKINEQEWIFKKPGQGRSRFRGKRLVEYHPCQPLCLLRQLKVEHKHNQYFSLNSLALSPEFVFTIAISNNNPCLPRTLSETLWGTCITFGPSFVHTRYFPFSALGKRTVGLQVMSNEYRCSMGRRDVGRSVRGRFSLWL